MLRVCLFGGHGGFLSADKRKIYLTAFGGCEMYLGTVTSRVLSARSPGGPGLEQRWAYFITFFGGTSLTLPTLTEEYLDLMSALRTRAISLEEWSQLGAQVASNNYLRIGSLTLFGGFDDAALPEEEVELDKLALAAHLGQIPEAARDILMVSIGQVGPQRLTAIRQAATASLTYAS